MTVVAGLPRRMRDDRDNQRQMPRPDPPQGKIGDPVVAAVDPRSAPRTQPRGA